MVQFPDPLVRDNNRIEVGGLILRPVPQEWGGFVTLQCDYRSDGYQDGEYSRLRRSYPDFRLATEEAQKLLWLPYQTPVLVLAHVENNGENAKNSWRLEADRILSEQFTNEEGDPRFDQNMGRLVGTVQDIKKMTRSRLRVVLLCEDRNKEPCRPEVVMFKDTLEGIEIGMKIGALVYVDFTTGRNPKTKRPFPLEYIKVINAWREA
jgi:hypothetical protein